MSPSRKLCLYDRESGDLIWRTDWSIFDGIKYQWIVQSQIIPAVGVVYFLDHMYFKLENNE